MQLQNKQKMREANKVILGSSHFSTVKSFRLNFEVSPDYKTVNDRFCLRANIDHTLCKANYLGLY